MNNKEFPPRALKSEVAKALEMSETTLQELLNRKYVKELTQLGYQTTDKYLSRKILQFLEQKLALIPEDFK